MVKASRVQVPRHLFTVAESLSQSVSTGEAEAKIPFFDPPFYILLAAGSREVTTYSQTLMERGQILGCPNPPLAGFKEVVCIYAYEHVTHWYVPLRVLPCSQYPADEIVTSPFIKLPL